MQITNIFKLSLCNRRIRNMGTRQGMRAREDDTLEVRGRFFFWRASPFLFATAFVCAPY